MEHMKMIAQTYKAPHWHFHPRSPNGILVPSIEISGRRGCSCGGLLAAHFPWVAETVSLKVALVIFKAQ